MQNQLVNLFGLDTAKFSYEFEFQVSHYVVFQKFFKLNFWRSFSLSLYLVLFMFFIFQTEGSIHVHFHLQNLFTKQILSKIALLCIGSTVYVYWVGPIVYGMTKTLDGNEYG